MDGRRIGLFANWPYVSPYVSVNKPRTRCCAANISQSCKHSPNCCGAEDPSGVPLIYSRPNLPRINSTLTLGGQLLSTRILSSQQQPQLSSQVSLLIHKKAFFCDLFKRVIPRRIVTMADSFRNAMINRSLGDIKNVSQRRRHFAQNNSKAGTAPLEPPIPRRIQRHHDGATRCHLITTPRLSRE